MRHCCDELHRVTASRFIIMVQRYKKYLNYANILPTIFALNFTFYLFTFLPLNIVPDAHLAAGLAEGVPRDVEPVAAGEQLVGVLAGLEEVHEALELLRVHRPDIGCLTNEMW